MNSPDGQRLSEEHPSEVTYYSFFELYAVRNPRWLIRAAVATIIVGGIWAMSGEPPKEGITADNTNSSESADIDASHSSAPSMLASIHTEEKEVVAKDSDATKTKVQLLAPIEPNAVIRQEYRGEGELFNELVRMVRANSYRCDSISAMRPFLMSSGFNLVCNRFAYEYEIEDKGGNWQVTVQ